MTWNRVPITGGVVNTRSVAHIEPGEYEYARNVRLRAGDLMELHRDYGRSEVLSVTAPEEIIHAFVAAFESAGEFHVLVTADNTNVYIKTAPIDGTSLTLQATYAHFGTVTKAWHVHRGDEYFIGTDATVNNPRINLVLDSALNVRYMGMRPSSASQSGTPSLSGSASAASQDDVFVYWITEYNDSNDVESGNARIYSSFWFGWVSIDSIYKLTISSNGQAVTGLQWGSGSTTNAAATKQRVYRHYCGNGAAGDAEAARYADGSAELIGGFVGEIDPGDTFDDSLLYKYDTDPAYPIVYYERAGQALSDQIFTYPQKWNIGTMFNNCLILSDGTVVRFGPPNGPEYQPSINFNYFVTERNDTIVGMHTINDVLIVLTGGGVHRIDYLMHEADIGARLGRATRTVSKLDGCVGRYANVAMSVEGEEREFVVYLSHTGLRMTDGARVFDACPDWSVSGAGIAGTDLASCVLVPDPANYRLRLYVPGSTTTSVWDFYYHGTLLKNGRFRVLGDHTFSEGVVKLAYYGYVNGVPTQFTASAQKVWREGVGEIGGTMDLFTGWIRPKAPMGEWRLDAIGIEHDADATGSITFTGYGRPNNNEDAESNAEGTSETTAYEQLSYSATADLRGNYVRAKVAVTGHGRIGRLLLDLEEEHGGAS